MKAIISGVSYNGACDPAITNVPREEDWPEPTMVRWGKGYQFVYEVTPEEAEMIASHLADLAEGFLAGGVDPETRQEARAFARDAHRIRTAIAKEASHG